MTAAPVIELVGAWASGVVGSALVTHAYLRWHWFEIARAHARIDRIETTRTTAP